MSRIIETSQPQILCTLVVSHQDLGPQTLGCLGYPMDRLGSGHRVHQCEPAAAGAFCSSTLLSSCTHHGGQAPVCRALRPRLVEDGRGLKWQRWRELPPWQVPNTWLTPLGFHHGLCLTAGHHETSLQFDWLLHGKSSSFQVWKLLMAGAYKCIKALPGRKNGMPPLWSKC
jgi:hypothetical protein